MNRQPSNDPPPRPRLGWRPMVPIVGLSTISVAPAFFVGALAVEIRSELQFGPAALGLAVSIYFLATAATTRAFGRFADEVGGRRAGLIAVSLIATSLVGMGILARSWWILVSILAVGGLGNAMAGPTTSLLLARNIPAHRLGLAFGIKQSSVPLATLFAGLAVPLVAVHVGWRWVLLGVGLLTFMMVTIIPTTGNLESNGSNARHYRRAPNTTMLAFALAFGLAIAAVTSLGTLFVDSVVASGFSQGTGGTILALGSLSAVAVRILFGWWSDRTGSNVLWTVAAMMAAGSVGYALLASGSLTLMVIGIIVAFGIGWGWSGLMMLAITQHNLRAPATATGIVQTGAATGGVIGPLATGLIAEHVGYSVAWLTAGGLVILAALAVLFGTVRLAAHQAGNSELGGAR